jgi:hypothetical protein
MGGWMGGWAVREEWADRWAESEGKGGVRVYEADEVKKKKRKNTLSFTTPEKGNFFF